MTDIHSLTLPELEALALDLGWKPFRGRQVYKWLWQKRAAAFEEMTDLARDARALLAARFRVFAPEPVSRLDDPDGTVKLSLRLEDNAIVETVFIPDADRRTVCVSTQTGCALGCVICRTGSLGPGRDLVWHEIAGQVLETGRRTGERITNVVFMGMGEPLLNYDNVTRALVELNHDHGLNIGARKLTVSTAGIPGRIREFARFPLQAKLAVSLNGADDATRSRLMPVNRRWPLAELIPAVREFTEVRGKRVTFEYVLVAGVNDRESDALALAALLRGMPCKVNLIPFNAFEGCDLTAPDPAAVEAFRDLLLPRLPAVTVRRSRGRGICGACGQLAGHRPPPTR
ncbi:23S rRNA (adenine(2503)-C(2))-methyltransferase RlmN [candidate division WOR-3 bacterium]|nr:23S rRNA (adenine(2503)-C(2))-methyltransferase RlmN [candidate division WOR-3 bacterium]